jgi:hypothetical protein
MKKLIIYPIDEGVGILIPTPDYLLTHTVEECAANDVPAGKPYKIIDASEIPSDATFSKAWEYQE